MGYHIRIKLVQCKPLNPVVAILVCLSIRHTLLGAVFHLQHLIPHYSRAADCRCLTISNNCLFRQLFTAALATMVRQLLQATLTSNTRLCSTVCRPGQWRDQCSTVRCTFICKLFVNKIKPMMSRWLGRTLRAMAWDHRQHLDHSARVDH
jgi:hypothetical protein